MAHRIDGLHAGFARSAQRFPEAVALVVDDQALTYGRLARRVRGLADVLDAATPPGGPPLTAVFGRRSITAYAGVLAALARGHGYVPLNPLFPDDRARGMLQRAGCRAVVADAAAAARLPALLEGVEEPLLVVVPEHIDLRRLSARLPAHRVLGAADVPPDGPAFAHDAAPGDPAYLLFTSGSTGLPKGVPVTHANVRHLVDVAVERYGVTHTDRFSQTFELTFDLSVFDLFVAWECGASVHVLPDAALRKPGRFIERRGLTVWFSVPSLALLMKRLGMLTPGRYPTLRWSLFCGEPLPVSVAEAWAQAAPGSIVENLYGPTEATIACTAYRWDAERSPGRCANGVVPIGWPNAGMRVRVADPDLGEVPPGQTGELLVAGPQVTPGYLDDAGRTAAAFVRPPGCADVHYRTGDLVRRPEGDEPLLFLGRADDQVKIAGHRVELGEVEASLREATGVDEVVALAWPRTEASATGITAFVQAEAVDPADVRARMARRLPPYMLPRAIHPVASIPLNANGKFDRRALLERLEAQR